MSNFQGKHLKVSTPVTTDGIQIKTDGRQLIFKTTYLPFSALKHLQLLNRDLPVQLRREIEIIGEQPINQPKVYERPQDADPDYQQYLLEKKQKQANLQKQFEQEQQNQQPAKEPVTQSTPQQPAPIVSDLESDPELELESVGNQAPQLNLMDTANQADTSKPNKTRNNGK